MAVWFNAERFRKQPPIAAGTVKRLGEQLAAGAHAYKRFATVTPFCTSRLRPHSRALTSASLVIAAARLLSASAGYVIVTSTPGLPVNLIRFLTLTLRLAAVVNSRR